MLLSMNNLTLLLLLLLLFLLAMNNLAFFACQMSQSSLALKMYQIVKVDHGETRMETLTGPSLVII